MPALVPTGHPGRDPYYVIIEWPLKYKISQCYLDQGKALIYHCSKQSTFP